jgi:hypothetical protein
MILTWLLPLGCGEKSSPTPEAHTTSQPSSEPDTNEPSDDSGLSDTSINVDTGDTGVNDTAIPEDPDPCEPPIYDPDPFVTSVASFTPGAGAGFGQDQYPEVIFGPPMGAGENAGGLDVLSLGENGSIVLAFAGELHDGDGADLIVFENGFTGWQEPAVVSVSVDGVNWVEWPCSYDDVDQVYVGCAGLSPVLSHPDNCIDARDASVAGGDAFDLADIGMTSARYVRVRDAGVSGPGGFDLDAAVRVYSSPQ